MFFILIPPIPLFSLITTVLLNLKKHQDLTVQLLQNCLKTDRIKRARYRALS